VGEAGRVSGHAPLLEVSDLSAFYGEALVLDGVSFTLDGASAAIVGRNGMGKTTLCRAIMGIEPPMAEGGVRLNGRELDGLPSYAICSAGIGYVAQGRELFPSLTVDEHLRMIGRRLVSRGRWSVDRVYELFPQLAQRRQLSGAQLSGGEQQMLAIGRALLTNPRLLLLDEPSEGLAPTIVDELLDTCRTLVEEGTGLLVVEQNLGVAARLADRVLVMVSGRIEHETHAADLLADEDAQRRYLGVESLSSAEG
jgi:branched-chain amino acid transport system ATP-binding protein